MSNAPTRKPRSLRHLPPPTPRSLLAGGLVLVLLLASIAHFTLTTYSLPAAFPTVLGLCLLGGILSMVIWALPGRRTQAVLVTLLATGVFLCLDWAQLIYGARACLTSLSVFWTAHTDYTWYYPLTNSLPDLQHQAAVSVFLGTALALLTLPLGWAILRLRSFTLVFALTLPWLMPAFLAESELDWPALLTLCACWATLLLSGLSARGDANGGARLILIALPLGVHTSFTRLREEVRGNYYYDDGDYSLYDSIDAREAASSNLITVAEKYTAEDPELTGLMADLEYWVNVSNGCYDPDLQEEAEANRELGNAFQALYDRLSQVSLEERDQKYPGQLLAQMESEQDKIDRASYNDEARAYNEKLSAFPVNLLGKLGGVSPMGIFAQEE